MAYAPLGSYDRKHQRFTPAVPATSAPPAASAKLKAALRDQWENTRPAPDDGEVDW